MNWSQSAKSRLRWLSLHGISREVLRAQANKQPMAAMWVAPDRTANHYEYIEQIRASGRTTRSKAVGVATADLAICRNVLRDNRFVTFSPENVTLPWPLKWIVRETEPRLPNPTEPPAMLAVDPPRHGHYRKTVSGAFTPRAISKLDDHIRAVTTALLDKLQGRSQADLLIDYASELPVAIIAEILGVPQQDAPFLLRWGNRSAALLDVGIPWNEYREATAALRDIDQYFDHHLVRVRRELMHNANADGILAAIVRDSDLDDHELKATMALLLGAGFETTVNLIGNGIVTLLRHPEQRRYLIEHPDGWTNAVEEILRYDSPIQTTGRIATEHIEIDEHCFNPGDLVILLLGGANRDPRVFKRPQEFDITRPNAREHLAFGSGIHACFGASLARAEGTAALKSLFERFPELTLDGEPARGKHVNLRGFSSLPVRLGPCVG